MPHLARRVVGDELPADEPNSNKVESLGKYGPNHPRKHLEDSPLMRREQHEFSKRRFCLGKVSRLSSGTMTTVDFGR